MDLSKVPLFQTMAQRMSWLGARQQVLAENIANADTPDYRPRDLKPLDFRALARGQMAVAPAVTNPAHLAGAGFAAPEPVVVTDREPQETTLNGNAVTFEQQLMKANQTAVDYEFITNLYRKYLAMFREALGRGV